MSRAQDHRRLLLAIAAAVVALDATTKALAVRLLSPGHTLAVLGGMVRLDLYRNFAGPRNSFVGHPILVSVIALAGVAVIALIAGRVRSATTAVAVGLLLGGGVGNLLDRLLRAPGPLRGGVIDWFKPPWSTGSMNLADMSITIAVFVLAAGAAYRWWRERSPGADAERVTA